MKYDMTMLDMAFHQDHIIACLMAIHNEILVGNVH